jgi:hypothetical protein
MAISGGGFRRHNTGYASPRISGTPYGSSRPALSVAPPMPPPPSVPPATAQAALDPAAAAAAAAHNRSRSHGSLDLEKTTQKFKTKVCLFWLQPAGCPYGDVSVGRGPRGSWEGATGRCRPQA